jgi:hypothetical protein
MAQPPLPKLGNVLNPSLEWVAKVKEAKLAADIDPLPEYQQLLEQLAAKGNRH